MDEKKYPVLYYDIENMDLDVLVKIAEQLNALYEEDGIHCVILPTTLKQEWVSKETILRQLDEIVKEVESWE